MTKLSQQEKALVCRLPFYIEHKLLQQLFGREPAWQMIPTDFTWQALCRYYALALNRYPLAEDMADVEALRRWLATGNRLNGFQYPLRWEYDQIERLRNPDIIRDELEGFIDRFSEISPAPASNRLIPLTGFRLHMKRKPSRVLQISKIKMGEKWPLLILDDGLFQSGYYDDQDNYSIDGEDIFADSRPPILTNHRTLDTYGVRLKIWRRSKFAWCWAQMPDIQTEDAKRFNGVDYMAALVTQFVWRLDEALEVLAAVLAWHQGRDPVVAALAEVIKRCERSDPMGTQSKLEKLPEPVKALLLPYGIYAM
jgi:hypothetical protein